MNEILDCKRMMFGKLWKELWSFYAGHWWLFRITKTWSENRQQVENFQFLVSKLSIARQNAVSQRNNILTDRNFIWFCGKNLGDTISLIKCSTVQWFYFKWKYVEVILKTSSVCLVSKFKIKLMLHYPTL